MTEVSQAGLVSLARKVPPTMTLPFAAVLAVLLTLFCTYSHAFVSTIHSNTHRYHLMLSERKHPLVECSEILSSLNDESLAPPARALMEAGHAWTVDWEQVTFACADAANAFCKIDNFDKIAEQLQDLSDIGGCTSVGPASSVPNLVSIATRVSCTGKQDWSEGIQAHFRRHW